MTTYIDPLRQYLQARHPNAGALWAYSDDNLLATDWLLATPSNVWGKSYTDFAQDVAGNSPHFPLQSCTTASGPTQLCESVGASVTKPGDTPEKLLVGHSWQMYEAVYEMMISARVLLDFTTLTPPTGLFLDAFRNAITYLSNLPEAERPVVRILYANPLPNIPPLTAMPFLESITSGLDPANRMEIYVTVSSASFASWNHAKIVAVDGIRALSGGHNLWGPHYLGKNPVFDVSMRLSGTAARHAQNYAENLWQFEEWRDQHLARWIIGADLNADFALHAAWRPPAAGGPCSAVPGVRPDADLYQKLAAHFPPPSSANTTPVLSIGRGGNTRSSYLLPTFYSYLLPFTEPSDEGILYLLSLAKTSIRLSLQSFHLGPLALVASWNIALFRTLGQAMQRGVAVDIVISNPGALAGGLTIVQAPYDGEAPSEVNEYMRQALIFECEMHENEAQALITRLFRVAGFRYGPDTTYPNNAPIPNHSKTLLVDDKVFYIGSQNLYVSNVYEFGWVVEDDVVAQQYIDSYWTPLWTQSGLAGTPTYDTDVATIQQLEAMQYILALDQNTRMAMIWADLKGKRDAAADPTVREALEASMSDLITNGGFATTLPQVLQALQTPFFSQTPPSTVPTTEAMRFVINLMTSTDLMKDFGAVVDAPSTSVDDANAKIDAFLSDRKYDCTALEVLTAFAALRRETLAWWAGSYSTWVTADGGASFTFGHANATAQTVRALAAADDDRVLPILGPTLVIDGSGMVTFDGQSITDPQFSDNTLTWSAGSGGSGNTTSAHLQFGTVTRATVNDSFSGPECFGTVTWPDNGATFKATCSLYGRGPARMPDQPDDTARRHFTVLWVLGALVLVGLVALLAYFAFRSRARSEEYRRVADEKRNADNDEFDMDDLRPSSGDIPTDILRGQQLSDVIRSQRQALLEISRYETEMTPTQKLELATAGEKLRAGNEALHDPDPQTIADVVKTQRVAIGEVQTSLSSLTDAVGNAMDNSAKDIVQSSLETSRVAIDRADAYLDDQEDGVPLENDD